MNERAYKFSLHLKKRAAATHPIMATIAAASTSMASAAIFTTHLPLLSTAKAASCCRSTLPYLPPRVSASFKFGGLEDRHQPSLFQGRCDNTMYIKPKVCESKRSSLLQVKASSSEETSIDTSEFLTELQEKWDAIEDKTTVLLYGGGAIVAVWLSSILVGAINSVPLVPKVLELVGLGYTGWFVYRYLLFKSSRKELAEDIEELKKKVAGTE